MVGDPDTLSRLRRFLPTAPPDVVERVRTFSTTQLVVVLEGLDLAKSAIDEIAGHWDGFRRDEVWIQLLADLVVVVEEQRGNIDAPLLVWPDMEESGPSGRLLFFYLFALCHDGTRDFLRTAGCPEDVIHSTFSVLRRHAQLHERKIGTLGVDAGWWMMPTLRGEIVHVGSLQFHRVTLGVGTLSPFPWYDDDHVATLGVGFRRGDPSIGLHIPEGTDLSPAALDATLERACTVLGAMWPVDQRRLATCQTWMLEDRLNGYLSATSNIVQFQQRFSMLPTWHEDDGDVLEFVFRQTAPVLNELKPTTTAQRAVLDVLAHGGHWRIRTGWLDFDGA
jgi:hypothetical protein